MARDNPLTRRSTLLLVALGATGLLLLPPVRRRVKQRARRLLRGERSTREVRTELAKKHEGTLKRYCAQHALSFPPKELLLLGLKQEKQLEVYGRAHAFDPWLPLVSFPFTATSGTLGPKLREGDRQIPEGFYGIDYLNPNSSYHLSMQVSYPSPADLAQAQIDGRTQPGSHIMIHGSNATIGCIPIGDDAIEELFLLVAETGIKKTHVWIAPHDFRKNPQHPAGDWPTWVSERYDALRKEMAHLPDQSR